VDDARAANDYWGRAGLDRAIVDALTAAGKDLSALTIDDLAPADQFHGGGKPATERLARLAGLTPGLRVLDVGGGLGGAARTLAAQFGCSVTLVDLTESYVSAGRALTALMDLEDQVTHRLGNALALQDDGSPYDVVWTQNSGMNISDKERLYEGFHRVLRPGGLLAMQEPMSGPVQPAIFPLMWATDPSTSFLRTPAEMRGLIARAGFAERTWEDVTSETAGPASAEGIPPHSAQRLIMGDALDAIMRANHRNRAEGRMVSVQAVFERR